MDATRRQIHLRHTGRQHSHGPRLCYRQRNESRTGAGRKPAIRRCVSTPHRCHQSADVGREPRLLQRHALWNGTQDGFARSRQHGTSTGRDVGHCQRRSGCHAGGEEPCHQRRHQQLLSSTHWHRAVLRLPHMATDPSLLEPGVCCRGQRIRPAQRACGHDARTSFLHFPAYHTARPARQLFSHGGRQHGHDPAGDDGHQVCGRWH